MKNLNEGKKKRGGMAYEAALREIDAQSAVVALEAKIEKLKEMAETKAQRLEMVSEDENLSELIDKKAMNEMRKEIKQIEKMQEKLEKLYEKKNGKKPKAKEIVDEDEEMNEYDSSTQMIPDEKEDGTFDMSSVGMKEEELDEASCGSSYEEDDDSVKEETNEEVNRWQKLAGIPLQENKEEISKVLNKNESPQLTEKEKKDLRGGIEDFLRDKLFNTNILANDSEEFNPTKEERAIQYIIDDLIKRISY